MQTGVTLTLLSLSSISSLCAALAAVLVLNPEDRISIVRGLWLTGTGFVFFPSLFELCNQWALRTKSGLRLVKRYRLTEGDVLDINNKVVSGVQALFCVFTGIVVCSYSCPRDLLRTSHFMSEAYAWFGAAYFFYDIWSMYKVHIVMHSDEKPSRPHSESSHGGGDSLISAKPKKKLQPSFLAYCKNEPVIIFHHLFIGGFGFLVIVYLRGDLGDCVFGFPYLMEISTPLVSLRGILSRVGLKGTRLYVHNGLAMLLTFLVFRVLSLPYALYMYSDVTNLTYWMAIKSLPTGCKISICILLLPQLYWFYLMFMGALKVLLPRTRGEVLIGTAASRADLAAGRLAAGPRRPAEETGSALNNNTKRS